MAERTARALTPLALAAACLALYATRLGVSPIYIHHDEVFFALQSHAIASTGRDVEGRFLPLYFHMHDNVWFQPVLVYVTALFLKVLPFSESAVRMPTAVLGVIDVLLMYLVARRLFAREAVAIGAAAALALTPAHFIHSRLAMDYIYPVPFLMAWLWCLLTYLERPRRGLLFAATLMLGAGFYSYLAAVVMMPLYLLLTGLVLFQRGDRSMRSYATAAFGFALPLLLLVPWFLRYPRSYLETIGRYGMHPAHVRSPLDLVRANLNWHTLSERMSIYWDFFNPSYLFFQGGGNFVDSTREAGVFLLPVALFLAVGLYRMFRQRNRPIYVLILIGFITAPLAASSINDRYAINRELELLPFAILIATVGAEYLWSERRRWRPAMAVLLVLMPIQFLGFYNGYFGAYRESAAFWFDRNMRGAMEALQAADRDGSRPGVYLSGNIPYADFFWRFYAIKAGRPDLAGRATYLATDPSALENGSLVLADVAHAGDQALLHAPDLRTVELVREPNQAESFAILEKVR